MNNQDRIDKYINEQCKNCKNKKEFDCEIRIFKNENTICTKCVNYER